MVLAITGAEALYADMGHFGRAPIRRAWFAVVFPCLMLNYLGQGALVLANPAAAADPFFLLCPPELRLPMVLLATAATVIASQAVISGAYSVSRQAVRLGFLPRLTVRHTSPREIGQVYVPAVNWVLFAGVLLLLLAFRSSENLATAYGLAVTGTFIVTTLLFLIVAGAVWRWATWKLVTFGAVLLALEGTFLAGNLVKVHDGGWLPLLIAAVVVTTMTIWQRGRRIVTARRADLEGPLGRFVEEIRTRNVPRVPGVAVFPHPTKHTTPLALRANVEFNHVLHEHVVIVSVRVAQTPFVAAPDRVTVDNLGYSDDGIVHLTLTFGFQEDPNIPRALRHLGEPRPELAFEPDTVAYFLSRLTLRAGGGGPIREWHRRVFIAMANNSANPAESFGLPADRTIVMGGHLDL